MDCRICSAKIRRKIINFPEENRSFWECDNCDVFQSNLLDKFNEEIYSKKYYEVIDTEGLLEKFHRVMKMPFEESDNFQRVRTVLNSVEKNRKDFNVCQGNRLLDIGSGTGVFPACLEREQENYWDYTLLEPDNKGAAHLKEVFPKARVVGKHFQPRLFDEEKFDLITLNRVLEHMPEPLEVLKEVVKVLSKKGLLYIEVPDVLTLDFSGKKDEAFASAHLFIFSPLTLKVTLKNLGFDILEISRKKEPSGKFTLYTFASRLSR